MKMNTQILNNISSELKSLHESWFNNDKDSIQFSYKYIRNKNSILVSRIERYFGKNPLYKSFEYSGINPFCHRSQMKYGNNDKEIKDNFIKLIKYISAEYGEDKLNDNSMNSSTQFIPYPLIPQKIFEVAFPECEKLGCSLITISFQSVYKKGSDLFGNWSLALEAADFQNDNILRKKACYLRDDVICDLDKYDKLKNGVWVINDLRIENNSLYKGIHNSHKKSIFLFTNLSPICTAILDLNYFRSDKILPPQKFYEKHKDKIILEFNKERSAQETWTKSRLRYEILTKFANGKRLRREDLEKSEDKFNRTLLSALRRHFEGDYNKALKYCGINLNKITSLYRIEDDLYPIDRVRKEIINLLEQSLKTGEMRLSRKYVSLNHKELEQAAIRHFKSWNNALKNVGLVPSIFFISASERTKKGYLFQEFIREFLLENGFNEVNSLSQIQTEFDFIHNKFIKNCTHSPKCKPDFYFINQIWDTKLGGNAERQVNQLERYIEHSEELKIITVADKKKTIKIKDKEIDIIGFKELIKIMRAKYGIVCDSDEINRLSDQLHVINFSLQQVE